MTATRAARRKPTPRPTAPRPAAPRRTSAAQPRTRATARSLPQETTGPFLRVFSRRAVSLRTTVLAMSAMFFVLLAGAVAIQGQRIEGQHRLDGIRAELVAAREEQRQLRADVAVAESPERIMTEAAALGLVEPGPVLPLVALGERGTAAP